VTPSAIISDENTILRVVFFRLAVFSLIFSLRRHYPGQVQRVDGEIKAAILSAGLAQLPLHKS
jgi:hypothetical protein